MQTRTGVELPEATEKQLNFIAALAGERPDYFGRTFELAIQEIKAAVGFLPRKTASEIIENLLAQPREARPVVTEPVKGDGLDLRHVPSGHYAVRTDDGVVKFFKIDNLDKGKWAGWVFVKAQASDDFFKTGAQRPGCAYRGGQADLLTRIAADPQAACALYGHEIGVCGICGRTLTDEESRARGVGPVCAGKYGW